MSKWNSQTLSFGSIAMLLLLNGIVFGPTLWADFIEFDDTVYVTENERVLQGFTFANIRWAFSTFDAQFWHPLTWLSLMLDASLFGTGPFGFHLTNIVLHSASTIFLFLTLREMTGRIIPGGCVAALFAIHPLHVESVAWIAERKDVLSGFWGILALWCYACFAGRHSSLWFGLSLVAFALSLMSKPTMVTLPCLLLLLDYWPLQRSRTVFSESPVPIDFPLEDETCKSAGQTWIELATEKLPFFLLALVASVLTLLASKSKDSGTPFYDFNAFIRSANACLAYVEYLQKAVWPHGLAVFYPHRGSDVVSWGAALACMFLIAISITTIRLRTVRPYLFVGWFWYLGTFVPTIGLVKFADFRIADRFTYIPLCGILIAIVWLISDLWSHVRQQRMFQWATTSTIFLALATTAHIQVTRWHSSHSLFTYVNAAEESSVALINLGRVRLNQNFPHQAVRLFEKARDLEPGYHLAHNNLGTAWSVLGEFDKALLHYKQAIDRDPAYANSHLNLGKAYFSLERYAEAIESLNKARELEPDETVALFYIGVCQQRMGEFEKAAETFLKVVELNPNDANSYNNLGVVLYKLGDLGAARTAFLKALSIDPQQAVVRRGLARVYCDEADALLEKGRVPEARNQYHMALDVWPHFVEAYDGLGRVQVESGEYGEAMKSFRTALQIDPDYAPAKKHLENVRNRRKKQ